MPDLSRRFRHFQNIHRRDDGSKWTGASLQRATRGRVSESWVSKLKTGRLDDPGFTKIYAISRVMGIPLGAWMEEDRSRESTPPRREPGSRGSGWRG